MTNLRENSFIGNEEIEFKMNLFKNNSMTRRQSCSDRFAYQGPDAVDHFQNIERRYTTQLTNSMSKEESSELEL